MASNRPGVYITEQLKSPLPGSNAPSSPIACFLGEAWKGPTEPTRVSSWTSFVRKFGGFPTAAQGISPNLAIAVHQFFTNGGSDCFITRVTDGTGVLAAASIIERKSSEPETALVVKASSVGVWGNDLKVKIVDRDAQTGRFDLFVLNGGITDAHIVERFVDLSMDKDDPLYVVAVVNNPTRGSSYITLTDQNSESTFPDNLPVADTVDLATGSDGSQPADGDYSDAIDLYDIIEQPLTINIPGNYTPAVINDLIQYSEARGDCFAIIDTAEPANSGEVLSYLTSLTSSSYAAVYYPWITVSDPSVGAPGVLRNVAPGGAVMGLIASTDRARGPFKAPAGTATRLVGASGVATSLTSGELGELNDAGVNCIRSMPNGVAVMGARTLKKSGSDRYVPVRRTLIWLKDALTHLTEYAIFESNDEILWQSLTNRTKQFLNNFWVSGGLKGAVADDAFFVKCDGEINSDIDIQNGVVNIEIGVALQHPAEFILISLGQWQGGSSTQESDI